MDKRTCGILLHITSLTDGTLGKGAFEFADMLSKAGQSLWQILPAGPVLEGLSPYFSNSVFAGGEHLIDRSVTHDAGADYADFKEREAYWLNDYALFCALKKRDPRPFTEWEDRFRYRDLGALIRFTIDNREEIEAIKRTQYEFDVQWSKLRNYANELGIKIIGDMPFYTALDSADCWSHSELFDFDSAAGCPPDAFCEEGQLWGNPTYRFDRMSKDGFRWWTERFMRANRMYDMIRVDHFRGFESYFSIPRGKTPKDGEWVKTPGRELFEKVYSAVPDIDLIAEDLGYITPEVYELLSDLGIPGTRVLEFAFDDTMNSIYLPHKLHTNSVVYTGTHDNDTVNGWFESLDENTRSYFLSYSAKSENESAAAAMVRMAYSSVSDICIVPMQDILDLTDARMNLPGTVGGTNWKWKMQKGMFTDEIAGKLENMAKVYGREKRF
ncbi:MAG: 4-alpha-glucanotransferase [Christensenellaceae bacterium]|nr:4-alpha-glucanotransferase [Christensenellaceae bacterium]